MVLSFRIGICLRCFKNSFIEVFVKNIYYDVECLNINELLQHPRFQNMSNLQALFNPLK